MKAYIALPLAVLFSAVLLFSCKKSKDGGGNNNFNLANTSWSGEAVMDEIKYTPVTIEFKETGNEVELKFTRPGVTDPYTMKGKWTKEDGSDVVNFDFMKGLEKMVATANLTDNSTKMANGVIKSTTRPTADPGSFTVSRR